MTRQTVIKRNKLASKIINEHFLMSLVVDRNINYLWYTYKTGTKRGSFRPFIFLSEINLLLSLGVISQEEKSSLISMLNSEDEDNFYLCTLSIETLRNKRIKIHGEWKEDMDVSEEFRKVVDEYPVKMLESYKQIKQ